MHWADVTALNIAGFVIGFMGAGWLGIRFIGLDRLIYVFAVAVAGGFLVGALLQFVATRFANRNANLS